MHSRVCACQVGYTLGFPLLSSFLQQNVCDFGTVIKWLCDSKSCQLLHSCTKNHIRKACSKNVLEGDSRLSELPLFDSSYITSY